ncbi:inositol polyphosphate 5-phosphatase [Entomortierella chlamydospora]|nr:inositol polyphosphate 5-phosphatase [Entomortierella chlamydospora]
MEAWVSPVSNWLFGHQKTKPVTAVSDQPAIEHQSRPLSEEEEETSDRTQDTQQEYMVRAQSDQQSNEPAVYEQPQNRQCCPTTLSKINLEEIVPQQDVIGNGSLLINNTSITDTTTESINPVEPSHQRETTEESLQQTLAQASQASPTQEEGAPKLLEKLRAVTRAIGWLLSNSTEGQQNSDTNTDAKGRDQDTGPSTKGIGNRRKKKGHKKPLPPPPPPKPVISKKRLKVFVGTWNMMGQMPRARDGLTGFIDVHDPAHPVPATKNPVDQGQQAHNASHLHLKHRSHIPNPAEESLLNSNSDIYSSMEGPGLSQHISRTPRDRNQVGNDHKQQQTHGLKPSVLEDPFLEMNAGAPYHIIVINTQECEREIREAVLFPSKVAWEKQLQASIGPEYVMIKTETMAALHIAVFVWKPIESLVNAHQANTHARNSDYKRIINELQLNDTPKNSPGLWYFKGDMKLRRHYNSPPPLVPQKSFKIGANGKVNGEKPNGKSNSSGNLTRSPSKAKLVPESKAPDHSHGSSDGHSNGQAQVGTAVDITEQFDYTFLAGDLNYRVDLTRAQADDYLQKGDLETLFAHDQLTAERKAGRVFEGFMEAPIRFKPTYKFDPITPISDNRLKNRQKTLLRHKSLVNLSDNFHMHHGSISRLEHNLSTPTLNVGASKCDSGSSLSLSAEANVFTKSENVNSGERTNGNSGNNEAGKDGSKVALSNRMNESGNHIKEPTRKLPVSKEPSSIPRPPNSESYLNHQSDNAPAQASHEKDSIGDSIQREDSLVVTPRKEAPLSGPLQPDSKRSDGTKVDLPENGERQLEKLRQVQLERYDTSGKHRVPSWTDRILWKSTGGNHYLPLEIGDDTRSGGGDHGKGGWSLLRKNRTKIASSSSQSQTSHSEETLGRSPEQYQRVQDMRAESTSESTTVLGSESGSMSILKLGRKKNKEGSRDGKMSLLESLKLYRPGHKSRRDSTPPTPQSSGMSEEDEDRAAVIVKQYTAHHDIGQFSDHRPVTAVFAVRFDWNLTDRGAIGDGAGNGASRWSPLDKVLEKIVSSTIIRPETETRVPGKKRSFPDAPEPARRSDISSRLGNLSNTDTSSLSTRATNRDGSRADLDVEETESTLESTEIKFSTIPTSSLTTGGANDRHEEGEVNESVDRTKRARISLNPAEDAKRGRRMMGMILGTLTQFKKQTAPDGPNGTKDPGLASREAVQERVREKLKREQELNEERRKKEKEEWEEKQRQKQAMRQGGVKPNQRRNEAKWENGYILTETRPRIRYMPKVLNETMQRRLDEQRRERGERDTKITSNSTADASANTQLEKASDLGTNSESATNMDLDLDGVVTTDIVVDVKEKSPISSTSSATVPASPAVPATGGVENNTGEDVVMEDVTSEETSKSSKDDSKAGSDSLNDISLA